MPDDFKEIAVELNICYKIVKKHICKSLTFKILFYGMQVMLSQGFQAPSSCADIPQIGSITDASSQSPLELLQTVFGHRSFKPGQQEAIESMISGRDTIVLIPAGGGKTVIYTLSCLITSGLAIVVSPLVARLRKYGINTCFYSTTLSETERKNILHNLMQPICQYEFLFISPEAVVTEQFQDCLHQLKREKS